MSIRLRSDRRASRGTGLLAALILGGLVGCGAKEYKPKSFAVEGEVRWKDNTSATALGGGTIEFEGKGGAAAKAKLSADGTFTLDEKLPPGDYRVRLIPPAGSTALDKRYQQFGTSGLTAKAGTEENQRLTITIPQMPIAPKPSPTDT